MPITRIKLKWRAATPLLVPSRFACLILLLLPHSNKAQSTKPTPAAQTVLEAATSVIVRNGIAVPAIGPVYKTMRPIDSGYFHDVCQQQMPPLPARTVTVGTSKYTVNSAWCAANIPNIPFPGTIALTPTLSEAHVKSAGPVAYSAPVITSLPNQPVTDGITLLNCSSTPGTQSTTVSVAIARATSLTVTNTLATSQNYTMNFSFSVPMIFTAGGSVTLGSTTTTATANMQGTTSTVTKTEQATVTVPAKSAISVAISAYPIQYKIGFSTDVLAGGTFKTYECAMKNHVSCPKTIDDLYAQAPAPGKPRTTPSMFQFPIRGYLTSSDASNATISQYNATLPTDCTNGITGMSKVPLRLKK
jgi:hypothetical protein